MTEQEKYVREHWETIYGDPPEHISLDAGEYFAMHDSWSAAADFTRQRLESIRQVEREIEWLTPYASGTTYSDEFHPSHLAELVRLDCAPYRILAREQSALAELRKGMRDGQ